MMNTSKTRCLKPSPNNSRLPLGKLLLCITGLIASIAPSVLIAGGDDLTEVPLAAATNQAPAFEESIEESIEEMTNKDGTAVSHLQNKLDKMQTLQGRFRQVLRDEQNEVLQDSTGLVYMQRPGKLRWETEQPYQTVTVSADSILWRYDVDLEQVTRNKVPDDLSQTPALLLSGNSKALSESFDVSLAVSTNGDSVASQFTLTPHDTSSLFKALLLGFNKNDALVNMIIVDDLGQRTSISFTNMSLNEAIDAELFNFTPPPGVDLLDNITPNG